MISHNICKSTIIPIKKVASKSLIYSLQENSCDPFTNSPPNEFMKKLHMRINSYNTPSDLGVNDNNCNKE